MLHQATDDVGTKTRSLKTLFPEPTVMTNKETAPSFMECEMAAHTVSKNSKDMAGTIVNSGSDATDCNPQVP